MTLNLKSKGFKSLKVQKWPALDKNVKKTICENGERSHEIKSKNKNAYIF